MALDSQKLSLASPEELVAAATEKAACEGDGGKARATREALEDSIQVLEEMEQVVRAVESIGSADAGDLNAS